MSLALLLVAAVVAQQGEEDMTWKLIACMQVTRLQLVEHRADLTTLAGRSKFPHKDVLTKSMAMMVLECVERVTMEDSKSIIENSDNEVLLRQYKHYTTLPTEPFLTEESVRLTEEEEILVNDIQARYKESQAGQPSSKQEEAEEEPIEQPLNTSLWLVYVLVVFLAFAGFVLYGIKRLGDRTKRPKKAKKQ